MEKVRFELYLHYGWLLQPAEKECGSLEKEVQSTFCSFSALAQQLLFLFLIQIHVFLFILRTHLSAKLNMVKTAIGPVIIFKGKGRFFIKA